MVEANIEFTQLTLDNGLRVVLVPRGQTPLCSVYLGYNVGSVDEVQGKTGFAHLFEHLMFDGSVNVPRGYFDKYSTMAGGQFNAFTSYDMTVYLQSIPSHQLALGLWLESDRLRQCAISEAGLVAQQKVVTEEISQLTTNQPYGMWREEQAKQAFDPSASYSWEVHGKSEDVAAATYEDVVQFFNRYYCPSNAYLVVVGMFDQAKCIEQIQRYLGSIPRRSNPNRHTALSEPLKFRGRRSVLVDHVPLASAFVSYHAPGQIENELIEADFLSTALGEGRSSRLYRRLVHDLEIASSVSSFVDKRDGASLLTFSITASNPEQRGEELSRILEGEIERVLSEPITEPELDKSRYGLATAIAYQFQRNSGIGELAIRYCLVKDDPGAMNTLLPTYLGIRREAVQSFAESIIGTKDPTVVIVNPA